MKKIASLLFAILILGCTTNDDNTEGYNQYITGDTVAVTVNFMPVEMYDTNTTETPKLRLMLASTEMFPCVNYSLNTSIFTNGNELIIRFNTIEEPNICFTSIGPAMAYVDLAENIDTVTFINGFDIDTYSVTVNTEAVAINSPDGTFTHANVANTFRYPENSFAFVCGTNTTNTAIYNDFLSILQQNPALTEFEFQGEGRIPYPVITDGHWVNNPSVFFKYTNTAEYTALADVLNTYAEAYITPDSGVSIQLISWNNTTYRSWMNN